MINNLKNYNDLEKAILKTLAFFDIFDYPLTLVELAKWLYQGQKDYSLFEINKILELEGLKSEVSLKYGFYFLAGREIIVRTRLDRYQIAEEKMRIALKTVRWLRWLIFVEMVAVCNNAGYNNATRQSDIDLFIIVKRGRIWWARLMITFLVELLGLRRHGKKIANRICLSFYITDDNLNLAGIALKPIDPYLAYWFATLAPIYDFGIYDRLLGANRWLKDYLPNFYNTALNNRRRIFDNLYIKFSKNFDKIFLGGVFGDWLEKAVRFIQLKKMKKGVSNIINPADTKVVISDSMLKFHENDKREVYYSLWREKLNNLGIL